MSAKEPDRHSLPPTQDDDQPRGETAAAGVTQLGPYAAQARLRAAIEHIEEATRLLGTRPAAVAARGRSRRIDELVDEIGRDIDKLRKANPE